MTTPGHQSRAIAQQLIASYGGRFSTELGIDIDRGGRELDRWLLAATLFGNRISSSLAMRTYRVLARAGIETIDDVVGRTWDELVALLDEGGYVRYDFSMATRLQSLADAVRARPGGVEGLLRSARESGMDVRSVLDELPGWGPSTVGLFLREVETDRQVVDTRARDAAAHLGLVGAAAKSTAARLSMLAARSDLDPRDLEAALVRLWLAHGRDAAQCPGGPRCGALGGPRRL